MERKAYPSDVSDDEWAFAAPYLTLMKEDAPQRDHPIPERGERVVEAGAFHCIPTPLIRRFVNPL